MIHVFIRTDDQREPFIETVSNYMFDEKGNLRLYHKGQMWFFPYTHLQYVYFNENVHLNEKEERE